MDCIILCGTCTQHKHRCNSSWIKKQNNTQNALRKLSENYTHSADVSSAEYVTDHQMRLLHTTTNKQYKEGTHTIHITNNRVIKS